MITSTAENYAVPKLPVLLSTASFLYLLRVAEHISEVVTNTHLLGSLLLGIIWASPHVGDLLTPEILSTFVLIGYIGLILLVFEAGLTTPLSLLLNPSTLALSMAVAITGIALPFALSFGLLYAGYGYTVLQAFGAGAALCSTSLGTTIALLNDKMKVQRVGVVLMTAALADDVVGLVIAGIVANLGSDSDGPIHWSTIVRPILVSLAFTFFTPVAAVGCQRGLRRYISRSEWVQGRVPRLLARVKIGGLRIYLFVIVSTLTAFVAGSHYAGTSELYGAYLAGTFLSYVFEPTALEPKHSSTGSPLPAFESTSLDPRFDSGQTVISRNPTQKGQNDTTNENAEGGTGSVTLTSETFQHPIASSFTKTINPLLTNLLSPLFFASIGASLPVQNLFTIKIQAGATVSSHAVIWKGIVYSLLMVLGKVGTGVWILVWPDDRRSAAKVDVSLDRQREDERHNKVANANLGVLPMNSAGSSPPDHRSQALFLGLAMVARGEIALIVAQLARPLLTETTVNGSVITTEEPFAVVIWAILLTTVGGAVGVGIVLRKTVVSY